MNIKFFKKNQLIKLIISLSIIVNSYASMPLSLDKVTAIVNDDVITNSELLLQEQIWLSQTKLNAQDIPRDILHEKLLEKIILNKIQLQLAKETGIAVDDVTLDKKIYSISQENDLSVEQLKKSIETEQNILFSKFRDQVREEIAIERLQIREVGQNINISKKEIINFINSPIGQMKAGYEYRLGHLLIQTPEKETTHNLQKAEAILDKLKNGESFRKIAIENSDAQNALQGGDLGWRKLPEIPSLLASYVPTMKVAEVIGPLHSDSGLHIVKLLDKRTAASLNKELETYVEHIIIKNNDIFSDDEVYKKLANIRAEALENNNFHTLAKKHSVELHTAGSFWVKKDSMLPIVEKKMNLLKVGEISNPFKSDMGWHLIKVIDRRYQKADKVIYDQARNFLFKKKFEKKLMIWLSQLRKQAKVELLN